jgi:acyl-CoA hydrolase
MRKEFKVIKLDQIGEVIAEKFKDRDSVNCYVGSNAATPTASLEALTRVIENRAPRLPFINMVQLLLLGPLPYLKPGLQDRVMTFSIFSSAEAREAAKKGYAFYVPCTLVNLESLVGKGRNYEPDVVILKLSRHEQTGELSLGLSADIMLTAIDNADLVIAELDPSMPFTHGQSVVDKSTIDFLIEDEGVKPVHILQPPDFNNLPPEEKRIGELVADHFIRDEVTLQVGIGRIPDAVIATIKDADYKDLGIQTELYGDGLMMLQQLDIVNNQRKKINKGYSTTSLIMGSRQLYDYVHGRATVQMRPCTYTNSAEVIRKNAPFVAINTAMGVDFYGNVWADFKDARNYYSGVGGQPDFIRALNDPQYGVPIIAMRSTTAKGESKIVPAHPEGVSLTASAYDSVVIVTEYGIADLRGLTAGEKALALASITHPNYRETYMKALIDDPYFTKPKGFSSTRLVRNVTLYNGPIKLN